MHLHQTNRSAKLWNEEELTIAYEAQKKQHQEK